jgi:hypothetical protein
MVGTYFVRPGGPHSTGAVANEGESGWRVVDCVCNDSSVGGDDVDRISDDRGFGAGDDAAGIGAGRVLGRVDDVCVRWLGGDDQCGSSGWWYHVLGVEQS